MFGSVNNSRDFSIFKTFHEFWFFGCFNVQFIDFQVFNVICSIGSNAKIINFNNFSLFFFLFVEHFGALKLFDVNGEKSVFLESVASNCKDVSLRLFDSNNLCFKVDFFFCFNQSFCLFYESFCNLSICYCKQAIGNQNDEIAL